MPTCGFIKEEETRDGQKVATAWAQENEMCFKGRLERAHDHTSPCNLEVKL